MKRPNTRAPIKSRFAKVNGMRLHYLTAGQGEPVILLHGYAQTSHMWRPLIAELAKTRTVIAPDLRGFGQSAKPPSGYDKKTMAQDIHALAASLGFKHIGICRPRHRADGRLRLRRAVSGRGRTHRADGCVPARRRRLDTSVWLLRDLWHFHFYGETPLALVEGPRAHLLRAFLERLRRRSATSRSRKPTASSTPRPMRSPAP